MIAKAVGAVSEDSKARRDNQNLSQLGVVWMPHCALDGALGQWLFDGEEPEQPICINTVRTDQSDHRQTTRSPGRDGRGRRRVRGGGLSVKRTNGLMTVTRAHRYSICLP